MFSLAEASPRLPRHLQVLNGQRLQPDARLLGDAAESAWQGQSVRRAFIGVMRIARLEAIQLAPVAARVRRAAPNT